MNEFLFFLLGFGYVFLLIWGILLTRSYGLMDITNVLLLVIIGLIYDNFIIAFGRFIGEGHILESLSYVRYWLHALFTPTLILFAWTAYYKTGLKGAKNKLWKVLVYLITIGLILYEWFTTVKELKLEPVWKNGVLTYESTGEPAIPLMVIIISLFLGVIGLLLLIKYRFYWLFIGIFVMTLGSIVSIWFKGFPVMNLLEFLLMVTLLLTKQFLLKIVPKKVLES